MPAFSKKLSMSDVKRRLCVPKKWWSEIRPLFGEDQHKIQLKVIDGVGMYWELECAVERNGLYEKLVLQSNGWRSFVNTKGLVAGDMVTLERFEHQFRGTKLLLRALKYDAASHFWLNV